METKRTIVPAPTFYNRSHYKNSYLPKKRDWFKPNSLDFRLHRPGLEIRHDGKTLYKVKYSWGAASSYDYGYGDLILGFFSKQYSANFGEDVGSGQPKEFSNFIQYLHEEYGYKNKPEGWRTEDLSGVAHTFEDIDYILRCAYYEWNKYDKWIEKNQLD